MRTETREFWDEANRCLIQYRCKVSDNMAEDASFIVMDVYTSPVSCKDITAAREKLTLKTSNLVYGRWFAKMLYDVFMEAQAQAWSDGKDAEDLKRAKESYEMEKEVN